jgi:hypothetical protein
MKKIIMHFFLCFSALSAGAADWRFIEENESRVRYYIDDSTIQPNRSMRRVWMLLDRKTPDTYGDLSTRIFTEFDCEQKKHRLLQVEGFKRSMANGAMSSSEAGGVEWRYISPATVINEVLVAVCNPSKEKPNKTPLNGCKGEADFIQSIVDQRQKGTSQESALRAVEYAVKQTAKPDEYQLELTKAKNMVVYSYIGSPAGDESAKIWFDACTKASLRMQ